MERIRIIRNGNLVYLIFLILPFVFRCAPKQDKYTQQVVLTSRKLADEINVSGVIGYVNNFPVFNSNDTHSLYVSREIGKLELLRSYTMGSTPLFINEKGTLLSRDNSLEIELKSGNSKTIQTGKRVFSIGVSSDFSVLYYRVLGDRRIKKYQLKQDTIQELNMEAIEIFVIGNEILVTQSSNEEDELDPYFNLLSYEGSLDAKPTTILTHIIADPLVISPDGRYIVSLANWEDHTEDLAIYDRVNKKFIGVDWSYGTFSYYSIKDHTIVFYNPENFETKVVKLP